MMKKSAKWLISVALVCGCVQQPDDVLTFDSLTVDKEVKLSNDDGSPKCSVHLQVAYATDENGHKAELVNDEIERQLLDMRDLQMRHALDSFANKYTSSYVKNFLPLYNQDRADTSKRSWYEYHYVITSQTHSGRPGTTAYIATIDYFEGGAHGINMQATMNFDNRTGRLITLDDVFVDGYEPRLNKILLKALCEKTGAKDLKALREKGYLYNMDMTPAQNFVLNSETLTFVYNPYEIAPYALGQTELTIAYDALKPILKTEP